MLLKIMAHSIPPNMKFTNPHNKIIKVGKSKRKFADEKASRERSVFSSVDGEILDKPIQVYRMWYRFLQLALELEQNKVQIVTRMEAVQLKEPKKDKWGKWHNAEMKPITLKVKVNKKAYADWHLDIVPSTSFDAWWKGSLSKEVPAHKYLFYPDTSVTIMKDKNDWSSNSNYSYLRIDNRRRVNDIVADFRMQLMKTPRKPVSTLEFQVNGTPNINTLINRYNALILQLTTTLKDREMLASKSFRITQYGMGSKDTGDDTFEDEEVAYSYSGSAGRAMRDLILPAKIALLSVCDGHFVKHPSKDYLSL